MSVKITAIKKDNGNHLNPHEAITDFRWVDETDGKMGRSTRQRMVQWMEQEGGKAYVGMGASKAWCYVNVSAKGNKFLQTHADGKWANNLLSLPEF
jgi:hypothetical protein